MVFSSFISFSMFNKLKQIKDMRSAAKDMQKKLSQETVHATAVGDKVQVIMDGNQEIISVEIDNSLLTPDKKKEVENGVKEAINRGMKKIQHIMARKMQKGEIDFPDLSSFKK